MSQVNSKRRRGWYEASRHNSARSSSEMRSLYRAAVSHPSSPTVVLLSAIEARFDLAIPVATALARRLDSTRHNLVTHNSKREHAGSFTKLCLVPLVPCTGPTCTGPNPQTRRHLEQDWRCQSPRLKGGTINRSVAAKRSSGRFEPRCFAASVLGKPSRDSDGARELPTPGLTTTITQSSMKPDRSPSHRRKMVIGAPRINVTSNGQ